MAAPRLGGRQLLRLELGQRAGLERHAGGALRRRRGALGGAHVRRRVVLKVLPLAVVAAAGQRRRGAVPGVQHHAAGADLRVAPRHLEHQRLAGGPLPEVARQRRRVLRGQ